MKSKSETSIEYFIDSTVTSEAFDTGESHQLQKMSEDRRAKHERYFNNLLNNNVQEF